MTGSAPPPGWSEQVERLSGIWRRAWNDRIEERNVALAEKKTRIAGDLLRRLLAMRP